MCTSVKKNNITKYKCFKNVSLYTNKFKSIQYNNIIILKNIN